MRYSRLFTNTERKGGRGESPAALHAADLKAGSAVLVYEYGEERRSRRIARGIACSRLESRAYLRIRRGKEVAENRQS